MIPLLVAVGVAAAVAALILVPSYLYLTRRENEPGHWRTPRQKKPSRWSRFKACCKHRCTKCCTLESSEDEDSEDVGLSKPVHCRCTPPVSASTMDMVPKTADAWTQCECLASAFPSEAGASSALGRERVLHLTFDDEVGIEGGEYAMDLPRALGYDGDDDVEVGLDYDDLGYDDDDDYRPWSLDRKNIDKHASKYSAMRTAVKLMELQDSPERPQAPRRMTQPMPSMAAPPPPAPGPAPKPPLHAPPSPRPLLPPAPPSPPPPSLLSRLMPTLFRPPPPARADQRAALPQHQRSLGAVFRAAWLIPPTSSQPAAPTNGPMLQTLRGALRLRAAPAPRRPMAVRATAAALRLAYQPPPPRAATHAAATRRRSAPSLASRVVPSWLRPRPPALVAPRSSRKSALRAFGLLGSGGTLSSPSAEDLETLGRRAEAEVRRLCKYVSIDMAQRLIRILKPVRATKIDLSPPPPPFKTLRAKRRLLAPLTDHKTHPSRAPPSFQNLACEETPTCTPNRP